MALLAVEAALLREVLLPGLTLSPGRTIAARVAGADTGSGGRLAIAGYLLDAELPRELAEGETVRLTIREVTPQHVLLAVVHDPTAAPPPPPPPVILPGGAQLSVREDEDEDEDAGDPDRRSGHAVSLALEMPALGAIDLRLELHGDEVRAAIAVAAGETLSRARAQAPALRDAIERVTARPVTVTVTARRQPLDVYA